MTIEEQIAELAHKIAVAPTAPPVTTEEMLAAIALDHHDANTRRAAVVNLLARLREAHDEAQRLNPVIVAATAFIDEQGKYIGSDGELDASANFAVEQFADLVRAVERAGR